MIVWINGAFGSGKTQTASELHRRLPGSCLYDPENVGYFIRKNFPPELQRGDFQDHPVWRETNYTMLGEPSRGGNCETLRTDLIARSPKTRPEGAGSAIYASNSYTLGIVKPIVYLLYMCLRCLEPSPVCIPMRCAPLHWGKGVL